MAAKQLSPQNGAVSFPTATPLVADFGSFDISENQQVESVAAYGAALYDPYRGSGTPHQSISTAGFAQMSATNTQVFGASGGLTDPDGAAGTWTLDTGCTISGSYVVTSMRLSHARLRAAVTIAASLECSIDPTITWPTT